MIDVISLGAGVQSSTMALMFKYGDLKPMPKAAIFADTESEPGAVYRWLDWLEGQLPFPVYRVVSTRKLGLEEAQGQRRVSKDGKKYVYASIPLWVNGAPMRRHCTGDYKILPIHQQVKRICGYPKGARIEKGLVLANLLLGISTDEYQRMKPCRDPRFVNRWPLIEAGMSRGECFQWMASHGYPIPPRSACTFCPYHSNEEWRRVKSVPEEWEGVLALEKRLVDAYEAHDTALRSAPSLHQSGKRLSEMTDEDLADPDDDQLDLFGNECEGMCGV